MPVVLTQFWLFVAPGLYAHEKKFAIPFVTLSSLFFAGGCLFSHYILFRVAWIFLGSFSTDYVTFMPRLQPTFALYGPNPVDARLRRRVPDADGGVLPRPDRPADRTLPDTEHQVLHSHHLHHRGGADPDRRLDPATLTMMAAPMMVLYGLSIGIAWLVAPRNQGGDDL